MARKRLPGGKIVEVMEGESREASMKRLISTGQATLADFQQARPTIDLQAEYSKENAKIAAEKSAFEKASIGYMETLDTAAGRVAGLFGIDTGYEERREATQAVEGLSAGIGRAVPAIAAGVLAGPSLAAQIPVGAATGALTSNDPMTGAIAGGAFAGTGNMIGKVAGRMGNGLRGKWAERVIRGTDEESDAIRKLANLGFKMTPGRAAGRGLKTQMDNVLESNPILGSAYSSIKKQNNRLLTKYAAKSVGVNGVDDIGRQTLKNMDDSLNNTFNEVADLVPDEIIQTAGAIDDLKRLTGTADVLRPQTLHRLIGKEVLPEKLTGRQYMAIRSELLKTTRKANDDMSDIAWDAINQLDDSMDATLGANELVDESMRGQTVGREAFQEAYRNAREKWKNLLVIEKYEGGLGAGGHVNPIPLNRAAKKIYGKTYTRLGATGQDGQVVGANLLPETNDFLNSISGMSTTRMKGMGGDAISANVSLYGTLTGLGAAGTALTGMGMVPAALALAPAAYAGSRAAMAAASPAFARGLGALGTGIAPQIADEIE